MRTTNLASALILTLSIFGCSSTNISDSAAQREATIRACGLQDDVSITADVDVRACDPDQTKKTTICHFPPGNPANAHTLCVGNAAVPAHVSHHNDTIGPCEEEPPCDPGDGDGGVDAGVDADDGDGGIIIL